MLQITREVDCVFLFFFLVDYDYVADTSNIIGAFAKKKNAAEMRVFFAPFLPVLLCSPLLSYRM
jgi:hypothetical protein